MRRSESRIWSHVFNETQPSGTLGAETCRTKGWVLLLLLFLGGRSLFFVFCFLVASCDTHSANCSTVSAVKRKILTWLSIFLLFYCAQKALITCSLENFSTKRHFPHTWFLRFLLKHLEFALGILYR